MRNFLLGALSVISVLLLLVVVNLFKPSAPTRQATSVAYSGFVRDVDSGQVSGVVIQGPVLTGTLQDGRSFQTYLPDDPALIGRLLGKGVRVAAAPVEEQASLLHYLLSWLPFLVFSGTCFWFLHRAVRALAAMTTAFETLADRVHGTSIEGPPP